MPLCSTNYYVNKYSYITDEYLKNTNFHEVLPEIL